MNAKLVMTMVAVPVVAAAAAGERLGIDALREKAAGGDAAAQVEVAHRYRDGDGVALDLREALRWGHQAADSGDARAMDFVGWMYFHGKGVPARPEIAVGYYRAASAELPQAAWNLGQCHFAGMGTVMDIPAALSVWEDAGRRGHGRSASTAAMVWLAGDGVAADPGAARRLAERAAELNDPNGLVVLGEIEFRAGDMDAAKAAWSKVAAMKKTGATGNPEQSSDVMAAQQGADLLRLLDLRRGNRGKSLWVDVPHVHQGWNNCGATSCAMLARSFGAAVDSWEFKKFCPASPPGTGTDWQELVDAAPRTSQRWNLVTFPDDEAGFAQATDFARSELAAGRALAIDFKYIGPQYPGGEAGHTLLLSGYLAEDDLYVLCNPAIASPGLQLITPADLRRYWRSDGYSHTSGGRMYRPAIVKATD
jgi:hypothetical protein